VSTATVSHVINGTRPVAGSTRLLVSQAMQELNFVPSALGRGLRTNTLKTIGFIAADLTNPFFAQVFRGVESRAREAHYTVIVSHSDENVEHEAEALQNLVFKGVDGILLAPVRAESDDAAFYTRIPIPLIAYDRHLNTINIPSVVTNSRVAVHDAINFFKAQGHEHFALVAGRRGLSTTLERLQGFELATQDCGHSVFDGDSRYDGGVQAAHWLHGKSPRPSVVMVGNNLMAMGLVVTLQASYPDILASTILITMDEEPWTTFVRPPLSVIVQPTHEIGRLAADLLLQRIQHTEVPALTTLPCNFVARVDSLTTSSFQQPSQ
jgi:LacI family transcriptional regulator